MRAIVAAPSPAAIPEAPLRRHLTVSAEPVARENASVIPATSARLLLAREDRALDDDVRHRRLHSMEREYFGHVVTPPSVRGVHSVAQVGTYSPRPGDPIDARALTRMRLRAFNEDDACSRWRRYGQFRRRTGRYATPIVDLGPPESVSRDHGTHGIGSAASGPLFRALLIARPRRTHMAGRVAAPGRGAPRWSGRSAATLTKTLTADAPAGRGSGSSCPPGLVRASLT